MSLVLNTHSLTGVSFPSNENQLRLKVGPYTIRVDVRDNNWAYECQVSYKSAAGLEIAIISESTGLVLAKGLLKHESLIRSFDGVVSLEPHGQFKLTASQSDEEVPAGRSRIQKKSSADSPLCSQQNASVVGLCSAPTARRSKTDLASEPMAASPLYTQYLRQNNTEEDSKPQEVINPGASMIIPVAGQQKNLHDVVTTDVGYRTTKKDWRGINSVHITVFGCKNLAFTGELDLVLRCQMGSYSRLSHVIVSPGSNPIWDTDFHYPASGDDHCIHFDMIEMVGKTVVASCTLDLRSLIVANKVRTWNGYLPLDTIGSNTNGTLSPMINSAVTLSKKNLSHPMVSSPMPGIELTSDYQDASGIKSKVGKMKLVVNKASVSSGSVSNGTRKNGKVKSKYLERCQYQSISVVVQSLSNIVDNHGGEPVTGVEIACGKVKVNIPARMVGRNITTNCKFQLPYTGHKYIRFILKDQHDVPIATQKMNVERLLFKPSTGICEKKLRLKAIDKHHAIAKTKPTANLSIILNTANCFEAEAEMCPQPSIMVTKPDGNAKTIVEGIKHSIHSGATATSASPNGFAGQASMLMSSFQAPKVVDLSSDDEEIGIELNKSFYNGLAKKDGYGFLANLDDIGHANNRLGARLDIQRELADAVTSDHTPSHSNFDSSSSSSTSSSDHKKSSKKKHHVPDQMLYSALNLPDAGDVTKSLSGGTIAQLKQTVNGLVEVDEEDELMEEENAYVVMEASHAFHSFELTMEKLQKLNVAAGVDKLWLELKYAAQSVPSYHYTVDATVALGHAFEFPVEFVGCKYMHITLFGADTKSRSANKRCIKLGQAVIDLETFIVGGSTDYHQSVVIYCFPDVGGLVDLRATMFNEPTKEMKCIAQLTYALSLRNKSILGPMAYPAHTSAPKASVMMSLGNDQMSATQKATFKPNPMNAALLAGIQAAGANRKVTPVANASKTAVDSSDKKPPVIGQPNPNIKNMMNELADRVAARKDKQQHEKVYNAQMLTTDVIKTSADNSLTVSKMEVPNALMVEVHSLQIHQTSMVKSMETCYLKFSYPPLSPFCKVKAKTEPAGMDRQGAVQFNFLKNRFPLPYDPEDGVLVVELWKNKGHNDKGQCIGSYDLMNIKDTWSKTIDKAIVRRRLQLRLKNKLVGEAVCSFVFQLDPSMATKDYRMTSVSKNMF